VTDQRTGKVGPLQLGDGRQGNAGGGRRVVAAGCHVGLHISNWWPGGYDCLQGQAAVMLEWFVLLPLAIDSCSAESAD